jgi:hypothetical protein
LQYHPNFVEKYGAAHYGMAGDAMPMGGALAYVKEHPEEDKAEIYLAGNHLKYSEMERLSKLAFFNFLRKDPRFVMEAFGRKCALLLDIMIRETQLAWSNAPIWQRLALVCGLVTIGVLASLSAPAFRRLWLFSAVFSVGAVASLSIPILTVVAPQVVSEEVMAIQIMILIWISVVVAVLAISARRYFVPGKANEEKSCLALAPKLYMDSI